MNGYGQAYTNPLATGNSPDAQQAAIVAALQRLQGSSNQSSTGGVNEGFKQISLLKRILIFKWVRTTTIYKIPLNRTIRL